MPLGLWKSKWEIHREEMARRDAEWREEMDRRHAEWQQERADAQAERVKAEKRHEELIARLDKNQEETMAAFNLVVDELRGLRREVRDVTDAVNANTEAILKLIDRFDQWEGRPPGSGRMGPRSA
jgi:chromosome segregation ATPase